MAVMERTTLSRKSFYVYFRDRHDLIARLLEPLRAELSARIEAARAAHDSPRDQYRAMFTEGARAYVEHGPLLRALRESSARDDDARRVWHDFTEPPITKSVERIREETKAGRSHGLDAEVVARALITMNQACFFDQLVDDPSVDPKPLVEALAEIWTRTIYGDSPTGP